LLSGRHLYQREIFVKVRSGRKNILELGKRIESVPMPEGGRAGSETVSCVRVV
jgi:hypothetical protein